MPTIPRPLDQVWMLYLLGNNLFHHGTYIMWQLRTWCARMQENRYFRRKNPIFDWA